MVAGLGNCGLSAFSKGRGVKRALITGITGQDGAYLARFLLEQEYEVFGTSRTSRHNPANFKFLGIVDCVNIYPLDLTNAHEVATLVKTLCPDEIYHLAGQSSVGISFQSPLETISSHATATLNLLESIRQQKSATRFYHSSSSEMFGGDSKNPRSEDDPLRPRSPYAVGKVAAHWSVINYREAYGLFACSGILFNHESPLRPERFVTRKISSTVARIKAGKEKELRLGDLSIQRDWGYAPEYVDAIWRMIQQDQPDDYVIGTGQSHTLQEFVEEAFSAVGLDWSKYIVVDPDLFRPNEVRYSIGNPEKANRKLKWKAKTCLKELIHLMVQHDLKNVGHKT